MKYRISNIRRGTGERNKTLYAHLLDENGELVISGTLAYITERLQELIEETTLNQFQKDCIKISHPF
jgi:hypothetical protein